MYKKIQTLRDDFSFCNAFYLVFKGVYKNQENQKMKVADPYFLRNVISKKFYPIQMHDCHEFLIHLLSNLQDEETPINRKPEEQKQEELNDSQRKEE